MESPLNFSITQLEYVLALHRFGHFAQAAEYCRVTQPTLSMQLQKLEENLGITLFDRSKKPILLTEEGKNVVEQIQKVINEARKISSIVDMKNKGEIQGEIKLGVIPTIAPYVLPRLLAELSKRHNKLQIVIQELTTDEIIRSLDLENIDVGLLATPLHLSRMHEISLFFEPFWVLCHRDHELAGIKKAKHSNLKYNDIWLLEEGHCLRNQILDVCSLKNENGMRGNVRFESGNIETLKNIVNSFGGYTLIPQLAKESTGSRSVLVPFERPIPSREVGLVHRRKHYKTHLIEAIAESILAGIPEEIRKIRQKDLDVLPISSINKS